MKNLLLLLVFLVSGSYAMGQCGSPSYIEPDFTISVQNPACPRVGELRVVTASGGVAPYTYTLLPLNITNATGVFSNLAPGTYIIQLKDACGNIRARQATITPYAFSSTSSYSPLGCGEFELEIGCSAAGPALEYGYAVGAGPIVWGGSPAFTLKPNLPANITLYVRDSCGNTASSTQYIPREEGAYIKILNERIECDHQEIYPEYYGFNSPKVCLYRSPQNTLVECKSPSTPNYTGGAETNFFDLPFGQDYYVIIEDGCYRDSAFFKDKTSAGGVEINPFAWRCNTFDLHADGNNSGIVCLYNSKNDSLIGCKPVNDTAINPNTGLPWPYGGAEFYNLPYGTYYTYIFDPCADSLIRIDTTVTYPRNFSTRLYYSCTVQYSTITSIFGVESPRPHKTTILYPDGSLAGQFIDAGTQLTYATWPTPGTLTVIQEDGCGFRDTSRLVQADIFPVRQLSYKGGCPGINGPSGGGDIILSGSAIAYTGVMGNGAPQGVVRIIKKDGVPFTVSPSLIRWNNQKRTLDYHFTNLATGTYVLESTLGCSSWKVYDTLEIKPYMYPAQEQTEILQCGTNPYSFRDTITGGVSPFTYQVLSTTPSLPALLTGPQTSNLFNIPPGTNLNTITIQVVDACGNSNTKTFPVNHLNEGCTPLDVDSLQAKAAGQKGAVKIYPNPARGEFTIAFSQKKKTDYLIEIYNITGAKLYATTVSGIDTKTVVIRQNWPPGAYMVRMLDRKTGRQFYHKQVML
jgi:hypothetical protein